MAEKIEDLNLPIAVVGRIIKDALPEGASVSKEARTAIARAASVFVLYLTSSANNAATKSKRKTINGDDVFQALIDTEFDTFEEPLREAFEEFKKTQKLKKDAAAKKRTSKDNKKLEEEVIMEEEGETEVQDESTAAE